MSSDQTNGHEASSVDDDVDQVRQSLTAHDAGGLSSDHFKPFAFAVFLVRRPKTTIALIWTVILLVNFIVLGTGMMQLTDNSDRDFAIKDHITSKRRWAYERAEEFVSLGEGDGVLQETQTIEEDDWRVQVMYEAGSGMATVATKANFDTMYRAEKFLREMPKYDEFCLWDAKTNACAAGAYVSFLDKIGYDPDTWTQGMIDTEIANAAAIIDTDDGVDVRPFFGIEFGPSNTNSKWMRSIFSFGGPLRGYRNVRDDDKGQKKDFQNFFERFDDKVRVDSAYDSKNMRVLYLGQAAFDALFEKLVQGDLLWAIGSMVFVWVYMTFHLKSFFLASVTMLQIILSFPLGFFIYHVFMGIEMFQSIHALAIFLMLGIAADNSFVIADCFIQGAAYDVLVDNLELRMSYVFRRAAKAIFITNFSTLTAFLATSVSALIPIATFGLWAAALILCNWFLSVTNFPCCLMLWHLYLRKCGTCSNKVQDEEEQDGVSAGDRPAAKEDVELDKIESAAAAPASNGTANAPLASKSSSTAALEPNANGEAVVHSRTTRQSTRVGMESGELRLIERFFLFKWSPFLSKWRYVILGVLVAWFISATVIASRLEPLSEQERFFPSDHFISRAQDASEDAFFRTKFDFSVRVKLVWGVKGIDMSGTNRFDPDDIGTVKWDSTFDLSDPEAQQHIYDVCQELIQNCTVGCSDAPATDSLVVQGDGTVTCFMNDFRTWARARGDGFPLNYTRIANSQTVPLATRKELFRERIVVFLNETNFFNATDYETDYSVGLDPSQNLRFVSVEAVSPLQPFEPHSITHPVYEDWEAFIDRVNARAPSTANKGFETGGVYWAWMIAEKELVSGTFKGLAIAASVAFAVLVIATLNWVMALYSIFLVFTVVASVTAVIVLQGWSLGASEAIAIVLVTGLSIDYVAHIAVAYVESSAKKRIQRTIEALTHLGISVIGGAVTSGGSASFLYGAIVIFFLKFATIITSTVGFALLAAVVFFPVVLMVGGPERDVGSLVAYYRAARAKMIEKGWIEAPTKQ